MKVNNTRAVCLTIEVLLIQWTILPFFDRWLVLTCSKVINAFIRQNSWPDPGKISVIPNIYYVCSKFLLFLTNSLIWIESKHVWIINVRGYKEILPRPVLEKLDVFRIFKALQSFLHETCMALSKIFMFSITLHVLSPVSTVYARNAWDPDPRLWPKNEAEKKNRLQIRYLPIQGKNRLDLIGQRKNTPSLFLYEKSDPV